MSAPALNLDDDDNLDDLDDVLDQFSSTNPTPPPTATTSGLGRPRTNTRVDALPSSTPGLGPPLDPTAESVDEDLLSSEFAKELAKGMENLMLEIGAEAGAPPSSSGPPTDADKAFRAAWEAMLVEGMNGQGAGGEGADPVISLGDILNNQPSASSTRAPDGTFQSTIKQTMEKMKEAEAISKPGGSSSSSAAAHTPESMEDLLRSLSDLGLSSADLEGLGGAGAGGAGNGAGGETDSELAGFLESMMSQLMSKEILYEPLKELADGFPGYLSNPPKPLSPEDKTRYANQLACVTRIIALFDDPSYSDSDPESNKLVVDLMSEMQSHGSPPPEIMGPLPPGFGDAGGDMENCTIA